MINLLRALLFIFISVTAEAAVTLPARDPFVKENAVLQTPQTTVQSCWIPIYFAYANDIVSFVTDKSLALLSSDGEIHADKRTNEIFLQDDAKHIAAIRAIISHLDKPGKQFLIAAKIINLDREYQKTLGVLFQTDSTNPNPLTSLTMNEPDEDESAGEFTVTIAKLAGNHLLDMQISALEEEGHATLISSPSLVTLNNQPATIESGAEVPYQETSVMGNVNVRFKKAVLSLQVTPQQMPNHHILLHITLSQDKVSALTVKGVPAIETQHLTTQVIVKNNQTIVLGGILETAHSHQDAGIPVLDDIPIAGKLFRHHKKIAKQQELLIFITPSMMRVL